MTCLFCRVYIVACATFPAPNAIPTNFADRCPGPDRFFSRFPGSTIGWRSAEENFRPDAHAGAAQEKEIDGAEISDAFPETKRFAGRVVYPETEPLSVESSFLEKEIKPQPDTDRNAGEKSFGFIQEKEEFADSIARSVAQRLREKEKAQEFADPDPNSRGIAHARKQSQRDSRRDREPVTLSQKKGRPRHNSGERNR